MAIRNVGLVQECFPKHMGMGTSRIKKDEETEGEKREGVWKEVHGARKKNVPTA